MRILKLILILAAVACVQARAADEQWGGRFTLGLGGGAAYSVTEAQKEGFNALGRLYAMYHISNYVAVELGGSMTTLSSDGFNPTTWGDFSTSLIQPDLRFRFIPLRGGIQPYVTIGAGAVMYTVDSVATSVDPGATLDGTTYAGILGAGMMFMIGDNFGLDIQGATNIFFSDNTVNATIDETNDAYWSLLLGLTYTFGSSNPDWDGDGLSNDDEKEKYNTDPENADTDGDGLKDGAEVNDHKTDPLKPDTDGDGLNDGAEVNTHKTDPTKADTDGDTLSDGDEVNTHTTDPLKVDTDGDGLQDGQEVNSTKTDPKKADTDGEGLMDGAEVNQHKTDPLLPDTDNDGLNDMVELETYQTGPNNRDTDSDGLTDGEEVLKYKTLPKVADTDRGSILDGAEVQRGTNPLNYDDDIDRRPKMEKGKAVVLEGIEFDTGKSTIRSSSEPILNGVLQAMMENPEVVAMISGHTDNVGKKNSNMKLSQARADAVKSWLVMKGIDSRRLITKGYGPERPIADNKTEEGRQKNRRIEFERIK